MNERDKAAPVAGSTPAPKVSPSPDARTVPGTAAPPITVNPVLVNPAATNPAATAPPVLKAELYVTGAQGQPVSRALSERERWLATQADAALRSSQAVTPGAALVRLEVNGLLPDTDPSYLYLCYQPPSGAPLEFWAGFKRSASLDLKRGLVGVASAGAPL